MYNKTNIYFEGEVMLKNVIKDARNTLSLKQDDVAESLGITKQTYLKWENGTTEPKASQVAKLAKVLKISADEICNGKLKKRYSLEEFIQRLSYYRASREVEIMEIWKHVNDHDDFFSEVNWTNSEWYEELQRKNERDLEQHLRDLES